MLPFAVKRSKKTTCSVVGNERGAALILAIVMLVILSILGSVVLMSSGTEMKISGNYQVAKQTFWVADRAVEYAISRDILMNMGSEVNLVTADAGVHKTRIEAAEGGILTAGVIRDLGAGDLPAKIAEKYSTDFGANFYQVSVTTKQKDEPNAAEVRIDTAIVRIFKSEGESVFYTDGEG